MSQDRNSLETRVEIRGLELNISGRPLLHDLNLTVIEGERIGITGPSGCGKTTLLRSLVKRNLPSGSSAAKFEVRSGRIGYIPQTDGLAPWYSVAENIRLFASMVPAGSRPDCNHLVQQCQLGGVTRSSPQRLSRGEMQRARLACAVATQPQLFCADEPLTEVGIKQKWELFDWWSAEVKRLGATLVLVSHDLDTLLYLCDRILILEQSGRQAIVAHEHSIQLAHPRKFQELSQALLVTTRDKITLQIHGPLRMNSGSDQV